jgi:hypothetical protein
MPFQVKLSAAETVKITGGADITEYNFRDPTSDDVFDLGEPFISSAGVTGDDAASATMNSIVLEMKPQVFKAWCLRLSGTDGGNFKMPPGKLKNVFNWLVQKLNPGQEEGALTKN